MNLEPREHESAWAATGAMVLSVRIALTSIEKCSLLKLLVVAKKFIIFDVVALGGVLAKFFRRGSASDPS